MIPTQIVLSVPLIGAFWLSFPFCKTYYPLSLELNEMNVIKLALLTLTLSFATTSFAALVSCAPGRDHKGDYLELLALRGGVVSRNSLGPIDLSKTQWKPADRIYYRFVDDLQHANARCAQLQSEWNIEQKFYFSGLIGGDGYMPYAINSKRDLVSGVSLNGNTWDTEVDYIIKWIRKEIEPRHKSGRL